MSSPWKLYRLVPVLVAAGALACGGSPTQPAATVSDSFSGTVNQNTMSSNTFTMGQTGTATVTIVSFSPVSTITMGVGIGAPQTDGSCSLIASSDAVQAGAVLSTDLNAGSYCVAVYDVGNVAATVPIAYQLTVDHP
jgi:hypothetical protein